ncbi:Xaa-Pro peptidase family protein [Ramlibacter tataouinensis]|uniref:M24 family metallopeptidase n=1 Tax=Ramlibacter tataouinensis TaxID=94132 RepID=UPI0022F407F5|nr:Xaa-Pro peptidase family protein [Ramlibacter tataouinensis]WBY04019.1 Xaa-Pro peptidase family protein [Ramlibacter tataouinensis]
MNRALFEQVLVEHKLDGFLGTTAESVTWLSGYWAMPQWIRRGPQAYAFQPRKPDGGSFVVTGTGLVDHVSEQELCVSDVHRYGFFAYEDFGAAEGPESARLRELLKAPQHEGPAEALAQALKQAGLKGARVGIEVDGLAAGVLERVRELTPEVELVRSDAIAKKFRAIKTPEEIARLRESGRIAERSILAALEGLQEGESEVDLARRFHGRTVADGAFPVLGCIGFGERGALPNVDPSPHRKLKKGDTIRFDVGGRYRHYRADIARIAVFGEPSARAVQCHRAVQAGIERAYEIIRPGLPASTLFKEVMEAVRKSGLPHYRRNHVGHGIGLDGYEVPALTENSTDVLQAGMVMCIETPYYEIGFGGFQVEDMVTVTQTGVESFMTLPRDLMRR